MPTFHVIITGHVDATRKPVLLPEAMHQVFVDDVETPMELALRVQARLGEIAKNGGMIARLKPFEGMEEHKYDKRVWVPMHMITYFETEIKPVNGEMPQPDPDTPGEFIDKEGNRMRKQ